MPGWNSVVRYRSKNKQIDHAARVKCQQARASLSFQPVHSSVCIASGANRRAILKLYGQDGVPTSAVHKSASGKQSTLLPVDGQLGNNLSTVLHASFANRLQARCLCRLSGSTKCRLLEFRKACNAERFRPWPPSFVFVASLKQLSGVPCLLFVRDPSPPHTSLSFAMAQLFTTQLFTNCLRLTGKHLDC